MAASSGKCRFVWPFFFILVLHGIAIFLFTRGFLLTRTELSTFSRCSDVSQSPCVQSSPEKVTKSGLEAPTNDSDSVCWTKPAISRLVIIVLDALRIDFVAPSYFYGEAKPWMDKLQVLQKFAVEEGNSARIFKAIADPPTTSLQRLKGLTTGGLPTFIDVGNSFGTPAISEDNLIHQMVKTGKRVVMMGDDTWQQLFPEHFHRSYPFPSFNVKDLHTVDDGCVEHLLPSLYQDDWDVLIAHFLGVDHAGHIFGVDSNSMIEKLEQYNFILEKVIGILRNQSGPGGLHENTFLLVMGDHGQTLNGDHGGGTPEEVETSLFAMGLKKPPASVSSIFGNSSCQSDTVGKDLCVSTIQQLDFAVTMAALLGIPFPFGSIGRVNPELFALAAGTWAGVNTRDEDPKSCTDLESWMQNYVNVLCTNSWQVISVALIFSFFSIESFSFSSMYYQSVGGILLVALSVLQVKRYIDFYSSSSIIGFSKEDMLHVDGLYGHAQSHCLKNLKNNILFGNESDSYGTLSVLQGQINAYDTYLQGVAELARSKWTEFDLQMMGVGLCILLVSLLIHFFSIRRTDKLLWFIDPSFNDSENPLRIMFAVILVAIRGGSFLSNSYILAEGKVANFLLGTTGIINLRYAIANKKMGMEAVSFLILNFILGFSTEHGLSKQALGSAFTKGSIWMLISDIAPMLLLVVLALVLYRSFAGDACQSFWKYTLLGGTILSYSLITAYWSSESSTIVLQMLARGTGKNTLPRIVYAVGFGLLIFLVFIQIFEQKKLTLDFQERVITATVSFISVWSPTVLIIMGRQGPWIGLIFIAGVWCIRRLQKVAQDTPARNLDPISVTQMSLLAVCLFFYTGHWCAFDGLRYGAAFVGFDDFHLIRQGILLAIDTFGISHLLLIFSLPFLVLFNHSDPRSLKDKEIFFTILTKAFLIYGLITAITTTFTMTCVTIHRRHLMVWGLFAPKYVFDVVGLILTDVFICLASLFYF